MNLDEIRELEGYIKFSELLCELFQFEFADLDFGVYRIFKHRRHIVEKYFTEDLPEKLSEYLENLEDTSRSELKAEYEVAHNDLLQTAPGLFSAGGELLPDAGKLSARMGGQVEQKMNHLRELEQRVEDYRLAEEQVNEVLLLLHDFFVRYYNEGDFIPSPRLGTKETYALDSFYDPESFPGIPYEGQDPYFHWATRGMHYTRTDQFLKNYSFQLDGTNGNEGYEVCFILSEVEVVKDNNKAKRYFFPQIEQINESANKLVIPFEYRRKKDGEKSTQKTIYDDIEPRILERLSNDHLQSLLVSSTGNGNSDRSVLRKRLDHYAALGTKDFFIHPALGGFLKRELDFFIKSRVLKWADMEGDFKRRLGVIKAFKEMAEDLIDFLDQLEKLQARLFEKKRLVIGSDYIVTMRWVPEDFWEEILSNQSQLQEWYELLALTEPVTRETLASHPTLPLYTKNFDDEFKRRLLVSLSAIFAKHSWSLDNVTDGILIHGENYGALRTLESGIRKSVKVIYIDPPYNKKGDDFLYKDSYRHGTWLSCLEERLRIAKAFLKEDGLVFVSVDDNEVYNLNKLLLSYYPEGNVIGPIIVQVNKGGRDYLPVAKMHEYLMVCRVNDSSVLEKERNIETFPYEDDNGKWINRELRNRNPRFNRQNRPNLYYPFYVDPNSLDENNFCNVSLESSEQYSIEVFPKNSLGQDSCWRWSTDKVIRNLDPGNPRKSYVTAKQRRDGYWNIYEKYHGSPKKAKSIWDDTEFRTESGTKALKKLFGNDVFSFPKPVKLIEEVIRFSTDFETHETLLDFFAGSGTSAHALINVNRKDNGCRTFICIEMGQHFHKVLIPRILKIVYTSEWHEGQPIEDPCFNSNDYPDWIENQPRIIKVLALESYDDTLHNLALEQSERETAYTQDNLFGQVGRDQEVLPSENAYLLRYFSDVTVDGNSAMLYPVCEEQEGENRVLRVYSRWEDPEQYRIKLINVGGEKECTVDWIETALLWLGLKADRYEELEANDRIYRIMKCTKNDELVAVVLRPADQLDPDKDRLFLEEKLAGYTVYINCPPVAMFKSLESALLQAMEEGVK